MCWPWGNWERGPLTISSKGRQRVQVALKHTSLGQWVALSGFGTPFFSNIKEHP